MVEVDARIHKVRDLGVNPNHGVDPIPLRRAIASARVSMLGPISVAFMILSFHCTRDNAQGLGGGHDDPWVAHSYEDAIGREAKCAYNKEMRARRGRERLACCWTGCEKAVGGNHHPPISRSSSEGEMEQGETMTPLSTLCASPSPH
jgi:hypothetical protein